MNYLIAIYRFFTRRWDKIKQLAFGVAEMGEELKEELEKVEAEPVDLDSLFPEKSEPAKDPDPDSEESESGTKS